MGFRNLQEKLEKYVNQPKKSAKTLKVPMQTRIPAAVKHPTRLAVIIPVGDKTVDSGIEISLPIK